MYGTQLERETWVVGLCLISLWIEGLLTRILRLRGTYLLLLESSLWVIGTRASRQSGSSRCRWFDGRRRVRLRKIELISIAIAGWNGTSSEHELHGWIAASRLVIFFWWGNEPLIKEHWSLGRLRSCEQMEMGRPNVLVRHVPDRYQDFNGVSGSKNCKRAATCDIHNQ